MTEPRNRIRTRALLVLPTAALAGLLAACGGGGDDGGSSSGTTTPPPSGGTTRVTADLADFKITLSQQSFKPGTYAFVMTNTGQHDHALVVEGPGGENRSNTVGPGESTTLTVTLKDGTYEVYCPVDGHKDQGMKTEITVAGAPVNSPTTPSNPSTPGNGY